MTLSYSEKYLVLLFCLFFAASSFFLFGRNETALDPDRGKDWWTLSFAAPAERGNLAFTLENHSAQTDFQYRIMADKKMFVEGTIVLAPGETKTITPDITAPENVRTSIMVTAGTEKKEIYRQ